MPAALRLVLQSRDAGGPSGTRLFRRQVHPLRSLRKPCPYGAIDTRSNAMRTDRSICAAHCYKDGAFQCLARCYSGARKLIGPTMTVQEVMREVMKDSLIYEQSGGGVTFTGGEPMYQFGFLKALAQACKKSWLHVAIETCGYASWKKFQQILELVDFVFLDIKLLNDRRHKALVGRPNKVILENASRIAEYMRQKNGTVVVRTPVVPGITDPPRSPPSRISCARACPASRRTNSCRTIDLAAESITTSGAMTRWPTSSRSRPATSSPCATWWRATGCRPVIGQNNETSWFKQRGLNRGWRAKSFGGVRTCWRRTARAGFGFGFERGRRSPGSGAQQGLPGVKALNNCDLQVRQGEIHASRSERRRQVDPDQAYLGRRRPPFGRDPAQRAKSRLPHAARSATRWHIHDLPGTQPRSRAVGRREHLHQRHADEPLWQSLLETRQGRGGAGGRMARPLGGCGQPCPHAERRPEARRRTAKALRATPRSCCWTNPPDAAPTRCRAAV